MLWNYLKTTIMDREELIANIELLIASMVSVDDNLIIHIEGIAEKVVDMTEDYFLSLPEYDDGYVD